MDLIFKKECYNIIGACYEVYNEHRHGFYEGVYHESLIYEFEFRKIPAVSEPELEVYYKRRKLTKVCRPDFVCYSKIILEIKAVQQLAGEHRAQVLNYLKATGFELGLLVNFGKSGEVQWERIVRSEEREALEEKGAPPGVGV